MKEKKLKILSIIHLSAALIGFMICVWNVIVCGLFAPAVDIRGGIGLAMVCTLSLLAECALLALIGLELRQKFTSKTFRMTLALLGVSLFALVFLMIGQYNVIPALLGLAAGLVLHFKQA